ncbi:MAG: hypothetical protein EA378_07935 [Phycisphaerales bacterium]|nr:MAG: hypothetical protein EA378_07935 [Phycisphaerales bacterium]
MFTRAPSSPLAATLLALLLLACFAPAASAQSYRPEMTVIRAGKVITVSGREIENGEIVIEDGEITLVGVALDVPSYATVIDARDQTVMPGLIHAGTRYGLDNYRRSGINADKLAASDVYADRIDFEPWLRAGFTAVAFIPPGDGISGRASLFRTAGPREDQVLRRRGYVRVSLTDLPGDKRTLTTAITRARAEIKKVEDARAQWDREQAERRRAEQQQKQNGENGEGQRAGGTAQGTENGNGSNESDAPSEPPAFKPPEIEPTLQPMVDLLHRREGALMVVEFSQAAGLPHLDDALSTALRPDPPASAQAPQGRRGQQGAQPQQPQRRGQGGGQGANQGAPQAPAADAFKPPETLTHAIRLQRLDRGFNWGRVSYFGSPMMWSDYTLIVDDLAERQVPLILTPDMVFLPQTVTRYNIAGELAARGAELIFVPRFEAGLGPEMFLNQLAMLVREGLSREAALAGVTRHPARLLGVSGRVGTIERGKQADLIFLSGDPLHPASRVTRVMIAGQTVWEPGEGDIR